MHTPLIPVKIEITSITAAPYRGACGTSEKTDRVMRSSKLEDSIYAELREDDPEMDMTENAAVQKLKSFPALSRDVFQSLYSLAPRRNDVDMGGVKPTLWSWAITCPVR